MEKKSKNHRKICVAQKKVSSARIRRRGTKVGKRRSSRRKADPATAREQGDNKALEHSSCDAQEADDATGKTPK